MIIPVEPLKKSTQRKINDFSNVLDSDMNFLSEIMENNIVLKDREAAVAEVRGWPNPVRRTAADRKIAGSNPAPRFETFALTEKALTERLIELKRNFILPNQEVFSQELINLLDLDIHLDLLDLTFAKKDSVKKGLSARRFGLK